MKTVISLAAALLIGDAQAQQFKWGVLKKCGWEFEHQPKYFENDKKYKDWCIHACHSLPDGKHPQWADFCTKLTGGAAKQIKKEEDELRAETKKSNDKEALHWENRFDSKRDDIARWEKRNAALKKELKQARGNSQFSEGMHEFLHASHEMKEYEHHANKDGQELEKIRDEEDHTKYNTAAWKALHAKDHQLRNEWKAMNDKADFEQNKVEAIVNGHHLFRHANDERNKHRADVKVNNERIHELRQQEKDIEKRWAEVFHKTSRGGTQDVQLADETESYVGLSAVAVTGIVIGASFFIMQKSRSAGKADHELSLIEK